MVFLPMEFSAVVLAVMVAVVGMPHGGLDHRFGRALLWPQLFWLWWAVFLVAYLGTAGVVVCGWFVLPAVTTWLFFLISAWHFGDDSTVRQPSRIVEGGMVVWIPLLFRPLEVVGLLVWVIPNGEPCSVLASVEMAQPLLWAIAIFFIVCLSFEVSLDAVGRKVAFAILFATLPTLSSFTLYFCGWHSTRELASLANQADPSRPWRGLRLVLLGAAPMAAIAVLATAFVAAVFAGDREREPVLVQAVFLGLSAVAVPHILLQEVVRRRGLNPFQPESVS